LAASTEKGAAGISAALQHPRGVCTAGGRPSGTLHATQPLKRKEHRVMKRMAAIAFAVALVFACRNQSETTSATNTTETVNTTGTETTGTTSTTSTGSSGGTVASLSTGDKEFIAKAAQGGMSEVQMGQMAASKGTTNDARDFANRMVVDH